MSRGGIRWQPRPEPRKFHPILSVRAGSRLTVIAAGEIVGVHAHFWDQRSYPFTAWSEVGCLLCEKHTTSWKGFLPAQTLTGARRIVEITAGAMRSAPPVLMSEALGLRVSISRKAGKNNGPLYLEVDFNFERLAGVEPFDPKPSVLHMWGLDHLIPELDLSQGQG